MSRLLISVAVAAGSLSWALPIIAQNPESSSTDAVRVTVSLNADGSRTVYELDNAHHTALATITERNGKLREKIRYELDGAGRFTSRMVLDPDGKVRSKSEYKYDKTGRVLEETQLGKEGAVLHKIAYEYDPQTGKQTGHSVFAGNGRSLDQTTAAAPSRSPAKAAFGEGPPGG